MPADPRNLSSNGAEALNRRVSRIGERTYPISGGRVVNNYIIVSENIDDNAVESKHIVAGSISAAKIEAGSITAEKIAANAVIAEKINAGAVTTEKLAAESVTAAKIKAETIEAGNIKAGTITGEKLVAETVTAAQIKAATITATQIAATTITGEKLVAETVTAAQIKAGTITAAQIKAGTITATELAADSVTSEKIKANTIVAGDIAAGTITSAEIASGTITGGNVAAGTITAGNITISSLSALSADLGTITAGTVTGATVRTAASGKRVVIDAEGLHAFNATEAVLDFDTATGNLKIKGTIEAGSTIPASAVTGKLTDAQLEAIAAAKITGAGTQTNLFPDPLGKGAGTVSLPDGECPVLELPQGNVTTALKIKTEANDAGKGSTIAVVSGTTYRFSRYVRIGAKTATGLVLQVRNAADEVKATSATFSTVGGGWSRMDVSFTADSTGTWQARINQTGAGYVEFHTTAALNNASASLDDYFPTSTQIAANLAKFTGTENNSSSIYRPLGLPVNTELVGKLTDAQLEAIAAAKITGQIIEPQIAENAITAAKIEAEAIEASEIKVGAVTETKVGSEAITAAKIAANAVEAGKIKAEAIETAKIKAGAVTAGTIGAEAVEASKIKAEAVETAKIKANAVTAAKIAADTITAGEIAAEAVTAAEIKAGTIEAAQIKAGTINASLLAAEAVETSHLKADSVTSAKIVAGTIVSGDIAAGEIKATNIATDAIESTHIKAEAVEASKIKAATITASQIAASTITATQIAGETITGAQIAANTITAGNIAAAAVEASEIKAGAVTAEKLSVATLSAISADLGTITAGTITGAEISTLNKLTVPSSTAFGGYKNSIIWETSVGTSTATITSNYLSTPSEGHQAKFFANPNHSGSGGYVEFYARGKEAGKQTVLRLISTALVGEVTLNCETSSSSSGEKKLLTAAGASNFLQLTIAAKRKINFGEVKCKIEATKDASNTVTVTHNLGAKPVMVMLTPESVSSGTVLSPKVVERTTTQFKFMFASDAAFAETDEIQFMWAANT